MCVCLSLCECVVGKLLIGPNKILPWKKLNQPTSPQKKNIKNHFFILIITKFKSAGTSEHPSPLHQVPLEASRGIAATTEYNFFSFRETVPYGQASDHWAIRATIDI